MSYLSDFQSGTKSGPTCHRANLEQRDECHEWCFHEKWPFWVTFNLAQKVVQLVTEPIWSKETSVTNDVFMKNGHFEWLSIWHKMWSNLSQSQFGAKRRVSRMILSWKMAILSDFQLLRMWLIFLYVYVIYSIIPLVVPSPLTGHYTF